MPHSSEDDCCRRRKLEAYLNCLILKRKLDNRFSEIRNLKLEGGVIKLHMICTALTGEVSVFGVLGKL